MPCTSRYVPVVERSPEDLLNDQRDEDLARIEQELAMGMAVIETDPITGDVRIVGASAQPEGMSDLCVMDALQQRDSVEFQLATAHAGVQDQNFTAAHAHSHAHGHRH